MYFIFKLRKNMTNEFFHSGNDPTKYSDMHLCIHSYSKVGTSGKYPWFNRMKYDIQNTEIII